MFIQVLQGKVVDAAETKAAFDRWLETLAPGATGWLGSTGGVTADGTFVGVVRFESPEAARANSDRPEQTQWWTETSKLFAGEVTFHDCSRCYDVLDGGSDQAGFVQVMQGRVTDRERAQALMTEAEQHIRTMRPDVIGGSLAVHDDDEAAFTQTMYFTSEAAARAGEQQAPPPEATEAMAAMGEVMIDMSYLDISEPWLASPR